jgi:hypothetical protein
MSADYLEGRQVSTDGRFYWDGLRWIPVDTVTADLAGPSRAAASAPIGSVNPVERGGRWFTPDQRLWWDGNQWRRYRRVTWNSFHIYSNPPEDRATLSRNLGIWCAVVGILGAVGLRLGPFTLVAAIAGPVSVYYALSFYRSDGPDGRRLQGGGKALAGIILSLVGLCGFVVEIVRLAATH